MLLTVLTITTLIVVSACGVWQSEGEPATSPANVSPIPILSTATATATNAANRIPTAAILTATVPPADPTATASPRIASPTATATEPATPAPVEDVPVIVLGPGHDRTTPGALGIEYQEALRTAFIAEAALEAAGYTVYLTRTDNEMVFVDDTTLLPENAADFHSGYSHVWAHASKALSFNPDLVIVLHYNGHPNPDVAGIEVYYCENGGKQNLVLGEIVRDELVTALRSVGYEPPSARVIEDIAIARGNRHFPSLGNVYEAPTTFIRNRYADAGVGVVLTEPLYMTNATELTILQDEATHQAIADAYVRAVDRYFGR